MAHTTRGFMPFASACIVIVLLGCISCIPISFTQAKQNNTINAIDANTRYKKMVQAVIDSLNATMDSLHLATEADKKSCISADSVDGKPYTNFSQVKIIYPDFAKRWAIEGKVWTRVLIGEDGIPQKYFIDSTDSPLLNNAAVEAVMNTSFTPAILNKKPICCWLSFPILFRLR